MELLLDTHVFLWWDTNDSRLATKARQAIVDVNNRVFVSAASAWEIAIKRRIGKLTFPNSIGQAIDRNQFEALPISVDDAEAAGSLPLHHTDPFDRLLIAQASRLSLILVTADSAMQGYHVPLLAAN